jgi:hypothetical protein
MTCANKRWENGWQWTALQQWVVACMAAGALVVTGCADSADVESSVGPVADQATVDLAAQKKSDESAAESRDSESPQPATKFDLSQLLSDAELQDGWISLFDGTTTFGWRVDDPARWQVTEGQLEASGSDATKLTTTSRFGDFELQLEYRLGADAACDLVLTASADGVESDGAALRIQLAAPTQNSTEQEPAGDGWRSLTLKRQADKLMVESAGHSRDLAVPSGLARAHLSLDHRAGTFAVRRIALKPLEMVSLFNGRDLEGWKTYPDMASRFTVTDAGELNVQDGRGQLETEGEYGDFVLQLECISYAPGLNSGIFFRCIPGEQMNGYESQIQNAFQNNDRRQPEDCGTGGIFRRQNARYVMADDLKWFANTILADGPHIAVWVNGIQVTDWTDTRAPDPNPRKGLRTEPGSIMIQGHDPTTNLSFRNLRIGVLP